MGVCISRHRTKQTISHEIRRGESMRKQSLEEVIADDIPILPYKGEAITARVVDVYDGDTCTVIYAYGDEYLKTKIRVLGVDTPEKKVRGDRRGTEIGNLEERAGSHIADKVRDLIDGKIVQVRMDKFDKYGGRVNGEIFLPSGSQYDTLTEYLLENKYAKEYHGEKKEAWGEDDLNFIMGQ